MFLSHRMPQLNDLWDCTKDCKSVTHGNAITSAMTKRAVSEAELCSYIENLCYGCGCVHDSAGRIALHMAASCGRPDLIRWLVSSKNANVNAKDLESGYTPLHRSLFYGKINCAIALMEHGANVNLRDYESLTPIDHVMLDNKQNKKDCSQAVDYGEVYVWGSNANYTLGIRQERPRPELLDTFHREHPDERIAKVCLDKFHCVLVTRRGIVYACGHGQGGRLGLDTEQTVLSMKRVHLPAHTQCKSACIGRDHTVLLTNSGQVWTCGANVDHVLGHGPAKLLMPRPLSSLRNDRIEGICCGRYHTVAWTERTLYTFGLNGGQLGHDKTCGPHVTHPKPVSNVKQPLMTVVASDGATCYVTVTGDIYVMHEYQIKKIATKFLDVKSVTLYGGRLALTRTDYTATDLKVALLTVTGNVHYWQEADPKFRRCVYNVGRPIVVTSLNANRDELLMITDNGEAFTGKASPPRKRTINDKSKEKTPFHRFVDRDECVHLKLTKIPNVQRGISFHSDPQGGNYAVIQVHPRDGLRNVPRVSASTALADYKAFYASIDRYDGLHDVIIATVNDDDGHHRSFYCHAYILSSRSRRLAETLADDKNAIKRLVLDRTFHGLYVDQLIEYIYTGSCALIQPGPCPDRFVPRDTDDGRNSDEKGTKDPSVIESMSAFEVYKTQKFDQKSKKKIGDRHDPIRRLQETARKLGVDCLTRRLDDFTYANGSITLKRSVHNRIETDDGDADVHLLKTFLELHDGKFHENAQFFAFDPFAFPYLHDVDIVSKDGKICNRVHKCVLAARLEYFNNLFSARWTESTKTRITLPISASLLKHLLEFIYTDKLTLDAGDAMDTLANLLIIADQLFATRLRETCELLLTRYVNLKTIVDVLNFARAFNAVNLTAYCMEFACSNLASLLESRQLESFDSEVLNALTDFYYGWMPSTMSSRVVTPHSDAVDDETIARIHRDRPANKTVERFAKGGGARRKEPKKTLIGNDASGSRRLVTDSGESLATHYQLSRVGNGAKLADNPDKLLTDANKFLTMDNSDRLLTVNSREMLTIDNATIMFGMESDDGCERIKSRVDAIKLAMEKMKSTSDSDVLLDNREDRFSTSLTEFPELSSSSVAANRRSSFFSRSSDANPDNKRVPRLSQKQRKRLSSESNNNNVGEGETPGNLSISNEPFATSPKNAWNLTPIESAIASPHDKPTIATTNNMTAIISETRMLKVNYNRMKTKSLVYTQIEDRALKELAIFYNVNYVFDELITVHRVQTELIAAPIWDYKRTTAA